MTKTSEHYTFEPADGYAIVTLNPELHEAQWAAIDAVGTEFVKYFADKELTSVLVDLTKLDYMGSSMVALLVRMWKAAQATKGQMVVVNTSDMIGEVLQLAGLMSVWTIVDSREDGIHSLGFSKPALERKRETRFVGFVGPLTCLVAMGVFIFDWAMPGRIIRDVLEPVIYGCAGLGAITSLIRAVRVEHKKFAIATLIVSVAVLVVAFLSINGHIDLPKIG